MTSVRGDYGGLYVGDRILDSSDHIRTVTGFTSDPGGRADNLTLLTDLGPLVGRLGTRCQILHHG